MKRLSNINESHWSEMNRRSQGLKVRKEDDVNFLNGKDFANYLSKRYSFENEYKIEYDNLFNSLTIPVCTELYVEYTNDSLKILYVCIHKSTLPEQVCSALKKKFKTRYGDSYIFLSPLDGGEPTNQFVVDVLDYMVDLNMDDINIKKSIKESHWSEMNRRSQGLTKRKEDDIDLFDMNRFFDYIKKNYGNKLDYLDKFTETISINTKGNLWIYLHYENRELSRIQFVLTGASSTKKYKKDFEQLTNSFPEGLTIKEENGYYYIAETSNRSAIKLIDYFLGFELYESHWSEMNRRSQGITVRKEDDINHFNVEEFYDYVSSKYNTKYNIGHTIDDEGIPYVYIPVLEYGGEGYVCHLFKNFYPMDDITLDMEIRYLDRDLYNKLNERFSVSSYNRDFLKICPKGGRRIDNNFYIEVVEYIIDVADEDVKIIYRKDVNESHWSEMNRRSQGIQKRKEDDIEQLDRDGLYDLIINKYELKPNYKAAQIMKSQTSPENKYISLPVFAATGTVYRMSITFKDKVIKNISIQLHNTVCKQWCPSLFDKFLIAENGTGNGIYIYSKNETVTNSLCMDVIETIVNDSERSALQKREN